MISVWPRRPFISEWWRNKKLLWNLKWDILLTRIDYTNIKCSLTSPRVIVERWPPFIRHRQTIPRVVPYADVWCVRDEINLHDRTLLWRSRWSRKWWLRRTFNLRGPTLSPLLIITEIFTRESRSRVVLYAFL